MDEAERNRIRALIKSKQVKPAKMTPEREAEVTRIIEGYAAQLKITQTGPNEYATSVRDVETGLQAVPNGHNEGIVFAGVITKGILMTLPDDAFLLSNVSNDDGSPVLVQVVGDAPGRNELWSKLRSLRLDGRRFYVFATVEALRGHLARLTEVFERERA